MIDYVMRNSLLIHNVMDHVMPTATHEINHHFPLVSTIFVGFRFLPHVHDIGSDWGWQWIEHGRNFS